MNFRERVRTAWAALAANEAQVAAPPSELEAALGRARIELEEARREIERLRHEYARHEQQAAEEVAAAGRDGLLRFGRRVGTLLSQLATMRALAVHGKEVRREDLLAMAGKLEKAFAEAGLLAIGEVGGETAFDPKFHQRLSGGDVKDGDPVWIRFVGYACGETVVTKALVSSKAPEGSDISGNCE